NADHRAPNAVRTAGAHPPADGGLMRPESARHSRIDHYSGRILIAIARFQKAALNETRSQRLKKMISSGLVIGNVLNRTAWNFHEAFDIGIVVILGPERRQSVHHRHGSYAGQLAKLFLNFGPEPLPCGLVLVGGLRQIR